MLSTINGFDVLLVMVIASLVFIIALQKRRIADLKWEMRDRFDYVWEVAEREYMIKLHNQLSAYNIVICKSWQEQCADPWCSEHCPNCLIAEGWCTGC